MICVLSYSNGAVHEHGEMPSEPKSHIVNLRNHKLVGAAALSAVSHRGITIVDAISFRAVTDGPLPSFVNFGPYGGAGKPMNLWTFGNIKAIAGRSGVAIDQIKFEGNLGVLP